MKLWRTQKRPLHAEPPTAPPVPPENKGTVRWAAEDQKRGDESMDKLGRAIRLTTGLVQGMQLHTEGLRAENELLRAGIGSELAWLLQCHEPDGDIAPYGFSGRRDALMRLLRDHSVGLCAVCGHFAPLLDGECPDCRH